MHSRGPIEPLRRIQVPGQYLGYSLQASRLLEHLLQAPLEVVVSLEAFADVGLEYSDGTQLAEEIKSRTSESNPVSDHAVDFWKTLRNWTEAAQSNVIDPVNTQFRLHVTRPFESSIAARFSAADTDSDARAALTFSRASLLTSDQDWGDLSTGIREHVRIFLTAPESIAVPIVKNFKLSFGTGRSLDDLKQAIQTKWVSPEIADDVIAGLLGWLKLEIDGCIERGEPATVRGQAFSAQATLVVRKLDRRDFLASVAREPSRQDIERHLAFRTYVRQLELIGVDDDDKLQAVTDFLLAEADRVAWAAKGRVLYNSFDSFENDLRSAWRSYKRRCEVAHAESSDTDRGKILYSDCLTHTAKMDGATVPEHFCRGSFHKLSDHERIGWHPHYEKLLTQSDGTPESDGNDTE